MNERFMCIMRLVEKVVVWKSVIFFGSFVISFVYRDLVFNLVRNALCGF